MTALSATRMAKADAAAAADAARVPAAGGLVAFPTETVYGLGRRRRPAGPPSRAFTTPRAGRPSIRSSPMSPTSRTRSASRALTPTRPGWRKTFRPGPLTLVLPKAAGCPVAELAMAGLDTIAVRVPAHEVARDILAAFGKPVVAPSANRSGHVSPTCAEHVAADLAGRIDLIVDGGATPVGVESTIIACLGEPVLLRPGGLPRAAIERSLGRSLADPAPARDTAGPIAPGMLATHYAPRTRLRLNALRVAAGEALLAFGPLPAEGAERAACVLNLSARGDLVEAAANLFAHLRALDAAGTATIAVMPIPGDGLGEAINDRLERAAAR